METPLLFLRHLGFTLLMTSIGFGLSVGLGVALAVGIVYSRLLERTVYTLLVALNSIPKVALAPLFVIWMGTGPEPKIAIALMLGIFPIVIDTVLGLRSVDPDMTRTADRAIGEDDCVGRNAGQRQLSALQVCATGIEHKQRGHHFGLRCPDRLLQRNMRRRVLGGDRIGGQQRDGGECSSEHSHLQTPSTLRG